LVDSQDEVMSLEADSVSLMHPALVTKEELDEWCQCFNDYEITSFIPQFTTNDDADSFDGFLKKTSQYGTFKRLMQSHNFEAYDGDGSWVSSYSRSYQNTPWRVEFELEECRSYMSYDEMVELGSISFYKQREQVKLKDVPKRLLSMSVTFLEKLVKNLNPLTYSEYECLE
jgi:hypothetical protein